MSNSILTRWQDIDVSCLFRGKLEKAQTGEIVSESDTEALHELAKRIAEIIQADQDSEMLRRTMETYVMKDYAVEEERTPEKEHTPEEERTPEEECKPEEERKPEEECTMEESVVPVVYL